MFWFEATKSNRADSRPPRKIASKLISVIQELVNKKGGKAKKVKGAYVSRIQFHTYQNTFLHF